MDVHERMSTTSRGEKTMTIFTINEENEIVVFGSPEEAAAATATPFDSFCTQQEFGELAAVWPAERLVAIWNSLAGVVPVKKFRDGKTAVRRIWERIERMGTAAEPKPEARRTAKRGAPAAHVAATSAKSGNKAIPAKRAAKGKAAAQAREIPVPREGSKTAQVIAMLKRKNGATLSEIVQKMRWQRHTVRGFMAGAMKKAGYAVESFKTEGGDRSYRINS
jgi:hypothetical protein